MPEQDAVELGQLRHKLHAGHQGDVEGVQADDGQTPHDVAELLHVVTAHVALLPGVKIQFLFTQDMGVYNKGGEQIFQEKNEDA